MAITPMMVRGVTPMLPSARTMVVNHDRRLTPLGSVPDIPGSEAAGASQ